MAEKRGSPKPKSPRVFGQALAGPKLCFEWASMPAFLLMTKQFLLLQTHLTREYDNHLRLYADLAMAGSVRWPDDFSQSGDGPSLGMTELGRTIWCRHLKSTRHAISIYYLSTRDYWPIAPP
jgi:hypothetical protein